MKCLVAIDSFKGCLTSIEANAAAAAGIRTKMPAAEVVQVAVSDGGEGWLEAFRRAIGGKEVEIVVRDPLMRPVKARYLVSDDTAIIEMAQASGLMLLAPEERNPLLATSYGTGQLVADAVRQGCRHIIVGLGGSATSDCGIGMLHALIDSNPKSVNDSVDYLLDHILHPYWFQDLSLNAQKSLVRKLRSYAYISKSIDFLVCEFRPAAKKFNNENVWYTYQPIIAIELDGASHSEPVYGRVTQNNQERRDHMKDAILKGIGVPLIRHTLNSNTITPRDYDKIKNRVYEMLSQYELLSQKDA